jgi:hypothetical protein
MDGQAGQRHARRGGAHPRGHKKRRGEERRARHHARTHAGLEDGWNEAVSLI